MDEQATQYGNKLLIDLVYKIIPFQEIHYQLSNQGLNLQFSLETSRKFNHRRSLVIMTTDHTSMIISQLVIHFSDEKISHRLFKRDNPVFQIIIDLIPALQTEYLKIIELQQNYNIIH